MTAKVETLLPHYYLTMSSAGPAKLLPIMYNQNEEKYPDTDQYIPPRKSGLCVCVCLFLSRAAFFTSLTRNPYFESSQFTEILAYLE